MYNIIHCSDILWTCHHPQCRRRYWWTRCQYWCHANTGEWNSLAGFGLSGCYLALRFRLQACMRRRPMAASCCKVILSILAALYTDCPNHPMHHDRDLPSDTSALHSRHSGWSPSTLCNSEWSIRLPAYRYLHKYRWAWRWPWGTVTAGQRWMTVAAAAAAAAALPLVSVAPRLWLVQSTLVWK